MLSPKSSLIIANTGAFTTVERDLWLPVLVGSRIYAAYMGNFSDLDTRLAGVADGSFRAKQLNETLKAIDRIGPVDAQGKSSEGDLNTLNNREGLIEYAISVLYGLDFLPKLYGTGGPFGLGSGGPTKTEVWW